MTNEDLKKKIVKIIRNMDSESDTLDAITLGDIMRIAAALIAAGIGDVKEHRIFAGKDGSIKQLYSGEEVNKMAKERKELKDELRSKVEYIHEQDEVIKEYKHRAEVAERALKKLASFFARNAKFLKDEREKERYQKTIFDDWINQAEEELAEEGKDG